MAITGVLKADFSEFYDESKKVAASMERMEGGAKKVDSALNQMTDGAPQRIGTIRTSFTQVDQVLAASGVNIGRYARGLIEIEEMSGKTVKELGALSTAASLFGAAMAGWNFGRAIAGFFELDTKIGNATAKLLGWGDVAAQEAGAGADVLALASQRAGRQITTMSEAIAINTRYVQAATAAARENAEATANSVRPQSDLMRAWNASAEAATGFSASSQVMGDGLPPVTEHTQSLLEVLDGILDVQEPIQSGLTFTAEVIADAGDQADESASQFRNLAGEMEDIEAFRARQLAGGSGTIQPLTASGMAQVFADSPTARLVRMTQGDDAGLRARLAELERLEGRYQVHDAASYFSMIRDQVLLAQLRMHFADRAPGFAGGVTNFSGGLARVHEGELLVNMPAGTDVIPRGGGGRVIHINLSGMVGDRAGLARTLKQVLVNGERAAGRRLSPAGAVG